MKSLDDVVFDLRDELDQTYDVSQSAARDIFKTIWCHLIKQRRIPTFVRNAARTIEREFVI